MNSSKVVVRRVFLLVWLVAATAFAQTVKVTDTAREHFKAGIAYLEEPSGAKYEEAYREFHTAYDHSPSYKILNNIALCSLFLERDGEAIDAYERYLAVAPKDEIPSNKRLQIDSDLKRLKAGLVKLTIKVNPATVTLVDEREAVKGNNVSNHYSVTTGELSLGIHPGSHRITLSAEGYTPQTWELEAAPASTHAREFKLVALAAPPDNPASPAATSAAKTNLAVAAPPETPKTKTPTMVYVSAVATGLFAASATVTGLLALSKKSDLETLNKDETNHNQAVSAHDDAKRYALFCDISLGATVLAASATAYFYFTAPKAEKPAISAKPRVQVAPVVGTNQAGMALFGSF